MIFKRKKKKTIVNKIFSFKLFVIISVLAVIFLGLNLGKEYYRKYQIQKEINSLQEDIAALEKNNYKLSQLIEYYKTDEFEEAQIRKRFNLGEEGENLAIMIESTSNSGENVEIEKMIFEVENLPNYINWWNYFFASKN